MEESAQEPAAQEGPEALICPGCMAENDPTADFCVKCGQPLSTMATTDPFRETLSEGYWYRTAASGRIRPIVFWGTWFIFLPVIVIFALMLPSLFELRCEGAGGIARLILLTLLIFGSILAIVLLLWRMTRNYRAARRDEREVTQDEAEKESPEG